MNSADTDRLRKAIRDIPDFPKHGITFRDITPLLANGELFKIAVDLLAENTVEKKIDKIVGIDARGFIFGAAVAYKLGLGFVPIRKEGKLPFSAVSESYALEYGNAIVEMHTDAIRLGERILLIDDLLATGGTAAAGISLVRKLGGEIVETRFLIELDSLGGRQRLGDVAVSALIHY